MKLTRFEWGCLLVVAASFVVRLTFLAQPNFIWDTAWYLMNSRAWLETGTFLIRWSTPEEPLYSGYWPPLFPIFAAPFVKLVGPSYQAMVAAAIAASALLTAAVFATTRDLYGRRPAFAAMAFVAASPAFYLSDAKGMSESLLALAVVLTVWAFLRSLERPVWLPVAGAFAVLAYLGKASLGLPFVAAGVVALGGWRLYTRGWRRVLRSPMDVGLAAAALAGFALLAATRSERVGGLGLGLIEPLERGFLQADCSRYLPFESVGPHCWLLLYPLKVLFVGAFLLVVTLPFSLQLRDAVRARRSERTDALWLAVLLPLLAGAVFTTTFFFTERRPFVDFDNIRYLTPAIVSFVWILLPHYPLGEEAPARDERVRRRYETWYWSAVGAMVLLLLFNPVTGAPLSEGLPRLATFFVLALVPLGLALAARAHHYARTERRTPAGVEARYVRAPPPRGDRRLALVATALLVFAGYFFSAWYAFVGVGMLVALSAPSPTRRVVAASLVLLASAAAGDYQAIPVDEAADALAKLPEGTIVGMGEIVVFPAAVAPGNVEVRLVDPSQPIPAHVDALVLQTDDARREYEGFTKVASWNYRFTFSPTLRARLWIEENVLGQVFSFQHLEGVALYVRDGSGLEGYVA